jgi:hypothetical protein
VDELKDVVPITEALGLWHPQEGIVRGHLKPPEGQQINLIGQLRYGCTKIVEDPEFLPEGEQGETRCRRPDHRIRRSGVPAAFLRSCFTKQPRQAKQPSFRAGAM